MTPNAQSEHHGRIAATTFTANGRAYACGPVPYAVVCLDGSSDEYLNAAMVRGLMPNMMQIIMRGARLSARGVMPSFTNPNNSSIITGTPPSVHGIPGNYFFDPATGREQMMNSGEFLRAEPITTAAARAGRRVAVVTAKDKLRTILSKGLSVGAGRAIGLSAEKAAEATIEDNGVAAGELTAIAGSPPAIYSAQASVYVLRLGAALAAAGRADFLYLSTTDFMQHAHGPDEPEALDFYAAIDRQLGRLLDAGVRLGITADHGMNDKQDAEGRPHVIHLAPLLADVDAGCRVILPITDPYVKHHASLGSYAAVHVSSPAKLEAVVAKLRATPGIAEVHRHEDAVRLMELPPERTADVVVIAAKSVVLGRTPAEHDLSVLEGGLRSHGGRSEETVPLILSSPLREGYGRRGRGDVRNFDVFDLLINGAHP